MQSIVMVHCFEMLGMFLHNSELTNKTILPILFPYPFSFHSFIIPTCFFPLGLLPSILPSIAFFNNQLLLRVLLIHLFLVLVILFDCSLFSSTIINTYSSLFHSTQLTLQTHISNASILLISSVFNDHVSDPYNRALHTIVLILFFFTFCLIPLASSSSVR